MRARLFGPVAAALLIAGCTSDPSGTPVTGPGQIGFSAGLGSVQSMASTANSGAVSSAATFVLANYEATERQQLVALQNARRAVAVIRSQPEKRAAMKKKKIRYLAVETERDQRAQGSSSVMLFDTESAQIVGTEVYDVRNKPRLGAIARFETYAATYVGTGH